MARALRAWAINRRRKSSVRNLPYELVKNSVSKRYVRFRKCNAGFKVPLRRLYGTVKLLFRTVGQMKYSGILQNVCF